MLVDSDVNKPRQGATSVPLVDSDVNKPRQGATSVPIVDSDLNKPRQGGTSVPLVDSDVNRTRGYLNRFNNSAFVTTLTELKAMAAAAIMGLRRPRAARGMPITL